MGGKGKGGGKGRRERGKKGGKEEEREKRRGGGREGSERKGGEGKSEGGRNILTTSSYDITLCPCKMRPSLSLFYVSYCCLFLFFAVIYNLGGFFFVRCFSCYLIGLYSVCCVLYLFN